LERKMHWFQLRIAVLTFSEDRTVRPGRLRRTVWRLKRSQWSKKWLCLLSGLDRSSVANHVGKHHKSMSIADISLNDTCLHWYHRPNDAASSSLLVQTTPTFAPNVEIQISRNHSWSSDSWFFWHEDVPHFWAATEKFISDAFLSEIASEMGLWVGTKHPQSCWMKESQLGLLDCFELDSTKFRDLIENKDCRSEFSQFTECLIECYKEISSLRFDTEACEVPAEAIWRKEAKISRTERK
jgi:hypothetical protein